MIIDTDNAVVKLCIKGMQAESEGNLEDAGKYFEEAWAVSQDDYEACIAAHYLARHQDNPQAIFDWNEESLKRAKAANDDRILDFYPSLYLNLGHSYETLGNITEAKKHYQMAADCLKDVPESPYKDVVKNGITGGFNRTQSIDE